MFQYNFCYCSIYKFSKFPKSDTMFQYNFCYCSIGIEKDFHLYKVCFNTTFVTVLWLVDSLSIVIVIVSIQLLLLFYLCNAGSISASRIVSIQLLLLFYWLADCPLNHSIIVSIQLLLLFYPHFYWFLILLYHKISPKNQDFLNFLPT